MRLLTLLTDFGRSDYYVAAVKGTVLRLAPEAILVDLSHGVPPGDVESAAFLLAAAAPCFPPGTVHLAVVDPGVGSSRRLLVATREGHHFVAPDNGLLSPVVAGAALRAVEREDLYLAGPGATFHGRDRFAPVAAALLGGARPEELGPLIEDPVLLSIAPPSRAAGRITGRVAHVDRFGNLVTDIPSDWLPDRPFVLALAGRQVSRRATHYDELPAGEPGVLPGSLGTLEISLRGADLAAAWAVARGARVDIDIR